MEILFLSHCVPNPPDKGERIRAFHELTYLAKTHRVHLACLARDAAELEYANALRDRCASVHAQIFHPFWSMARAGARFAAGGCLTTSFYKNRALEGQVTALAGSVRLDAAVVYSVAMASYAPPEIPMLLDLVDADSEKWFDYARLRRAGFLYGMEGRRLRQVEGDFSRAAERSFLTTQHEIEVFRRYWPNVRVGLMENGVDSDWFDPSRAPSIPSLAGRRFVVFVGVMSYYPNADAVRWFADRILPALRERIAGLEFFIVGRDPSAAVRSLANRPYIQVTGSVTDVRPYLKASMAVVAPLRIARGVQNKVLEALAMGKRVMASPAVCDTLAPVPPGVVPCESALDYIGALESQTSDAGGDADDAIRSGARQRFRWDRNMQVLCEELCSLAKRRQQPRTRELGPVRAGC